MKLDDFESVFRSAVKERFQLHVPALDTGLLLTDLDDDASRALQERIEKFFSRAHGAGIEWSRLIKGDFEHVAEVVALVEANKPDMIACYRHLIGYGRGLAHSLGSAVDTLTQVTSVPVLLLPSPDRDDLDSCLAPAERVLVVTDHLTGDDRLVSWGVHLCPDEGKLFLAHIEDDETYARYIDVIGKVKGLDTELATEKIAEKLLAMPRDYIETIAGKLASEGIQEDIVPIVRMGHALSDYRAIIDENQIDLVVVNTKDEKQLAMHGMAYALAVEVRDRPLLLL